MKFMICWATCISEWLYQGAVKPRKVLHHLPGSHLELQNHIGSDQKYCICQHSFPFLYAEDNGAFSEQLYFIPKCLDEVYIIIIIMLVY